MASHPHPSRDPQDGHEKSDIRVGAVVGFGAGLALILLVTLLGVAWLFSVVSKTEERQKRSDLPLVVDEHQASPSLPPQPTLEGIEPPGSAGPAHGRRPPFVVSTRDDLSRPTHWVDRDQQIAAIPIEDRRDPDYQGEFFRRFLSATPLTMRKGRTWQQAAQALPSDANSGRPPTEQQP